MYAIPSLDQSTLGTHLFKIVFSPLPNPAGCAYENAIHTVNFNKKVIFYDKIQLCRKSLLFVPNLHGSHLFQYMPLKLLEDWFMNIAILCLVAIQELDS